MEKFRKGVRLFAVNLVVFFTLFTFAASAFGKVPVVFLLSGHWAAEDGQYGLEKQEDLLRDLIDEEFSLYDDAYLEVKVKTLYDDSGNTDYLIVYLLDRDTYSVETARVELDDDLIVLYTERDYEEQPDDAAQEPACIWGTCPDPGVQMVFATMHTEIPSAVAAVDKAAQIAENNGYKVKVLKGSQENKSAVMNWLGCNNLILFGRVGHGSPYGIMVNDGMLSYTYFQGLPSTALNDKVLYFNSCQVQNDPLKSAIVNGGVQKFIGGITNLMIGPSEEVFKCWMNKVIAEEKGMTPSLETCSAQHPWAGVHGISGNGLDYLNGTGSTPPPPPVNDELKNGETRSKLGASQDDWLYFKINVPVGAKNLKVKISGGSGDADLYTRFGSKPTESQYDCRPWLDGNNETCVPFANPAAGYYYIGLKGYSSFSGVSLTAGYDSGGAGSNPPPANDELNNGETRTNLGTSEGDWLYFKINVPAGAKNLKIKISGGSGDADMYTRFGSKPTDSEYDCRPWIDGNNETCGPFTNPAAGYYYIGLKGYNSFSGVSLTAGYGTYSGNGDFDPTCPAYQQGVGWE